ncbi:MAG: cyclase family protein [Pirellulales bacterium]
MISTFKMSCAFWLCAGTLTAAMLLTGNALGADRPKTAAEVDALVSELSNWGRWGKDDQLGALNLITPEKRKQAVTLVREGTSVSLARILEKQPAVDNPDPFVQTMLPNVNGGDSQWSLDRYSVAYHGYAHTHLDALCHLFYRGKMYNGFSQNEVGPQGAARLSIHNAKSGVFTRGVLFDIPRLRGLRYLEPGTPIYPEDLDAWEKHAGVKVTSGDVIFIRTGRWQRRAMLGPWDALNPGIAGLHVSCARWLKQRDVAILGSDAASDVIPSGIPGMSHPVHLLALHAMGMNIFDNCDLEELSEVAQARKRWEFLLTAAPMPVEGGTGSPLNPLATY